MSSELMVTSYGVSRDHTRVFIIINHFDSVLNFRAAHRTVLRVRPYEFTGEDGLSRTVTRTVLSNLKRDGTGHFTGVLRVTAVFKYSNYTNMLRLCLQRTNIYSNGGDNHPATTPLPRNMYETMRWSLPLITPAYGHPTIQRCYVFRSGRFCVM